MADDHHHEHTEIQPNPDYDGPGQHCLPPDVEQGPGPTILFVLLMVAIVIVSVYLGELI